jgi:hypothetical protein
MAKFPHQEGPEPGIDERLSRDGKKGVKIAVKVVDIFGNDTMTIVDVSLKR